MGVLRQTSLRTVSLSGPVEAASEAGHIEIAALLLRTGISRDLRPLEKTKGLACAARGGRAAVVRLFLNIAAEQARGAGSLDLNSAPWSASESGHLAIVQLLFNARAEMDHVLDHHPNTTPLIA